MRLRPFATSGRPAPEDDGYDAPSMQHLSVDGYVAEPVVAHWQQVGKYLLPLASVSNQNDPGVLRRDFVGELSSAPNVYMPQWSAPSRGSSVNQTGGMVNTPISSYAAGQVNVNAITANADQASMIASFISSKSPRYVGFSVSGGE